MSAQPAYAGPLRVERGGLAPANLPDLPRPRMTPAEIPLTLSADVLRLPISMNARAVLAEVVSLHAATGCCDASDAHFAARLTIDKDTVSVAVQKLEALGLVVKVTTRTPTGLYRTLTPDPAAITAKAATNPYPENPAKGTRKFRVSQAGNSGEGYPEIPAKVPGNSGDPYPEIPATLPGNSGGNIPVNIPVEITLPDDAASAAALGPEKKIGAVEILPAPLPAEGLSSAPPVAAPPPQKLVLMRLSPLASFPAFADAWACATQANPDTYADYTQADLLHYHTALLDWSNANGKKKIDWLATIRSSMRNDAAKGQLKKLCPAGVAADSPVLKRLATAEAALALNEYDEAGNRLN